MGPAELEITIPFVPPSSNNIYVNRRGGGRFLSKEAEAWKNRFLAEVIGPHQLAIHRFCQEVEKDPKTVIIMWLGFFFDRADVINSTYDDPAAKKKAKDRYKKMDVQNRIKLITDALYKALALDDKLNFREILDKYVAADGKPRVCIRLWRGNPGDFGV